MAMYTLHNPSGSWEQLVSNLLPGDSAEQTRARTAMQSVDRRHFLEPSTPEVLAYQVELPGIFCTALGL